MFQDICIPICKFIVINITVRILLFIVQSVRHAQLFAPLWIAAHQSSLSFTFTFWSLLKHIHWVDYYIQPSHLLSSSSPPSLNLSQHQGLFHWVGSSHQVASVLEHQLQHHSFQWIFRADLFYDWLVWSPCSLRDTQESSPAQFESIYSSALSLLYVATLTSIHDYCKKHAMTIWTFVSKVMSLLF